jgi:hypothetical protein
MKAVLIEWEDACGPEKYWHFPETIDHTPGEIVSIGFVIQKNKRTVTICQSVDPKGGYGGLHIIPRSVVKKMTRVKR